MLRILELKIRALSSEGATGRITAIGAQVGGPELGDLVSSSWLVPDWAMILPVGVGARDLVAEDVVLKGAGRAGFAFDAIGCLQRRSTRCAEPLLEGGGGGSRGGGGGAEVIFTWRGLTATLGAFFGLTSDADPLSPGQAEPQGNSFLSLRPTAVYKIIDNDSDEILKLGITQRIPAKARYPGFLYTALNADLCTIQ